MAPSKRPAASTAGAPAKKAKGPAVAKICNEIAKALKSSSFPKSVVTMLSQSMPLCLAETKEERHDFQAKVVEMAGDVLASVKAEMESKIAAGEEKLAATDSEKAKREAAVEETKKATEEKTALADTAKNAAEAGAAELKAAEKAAKTAEQEQKSGDAKLSQAEAKKEKLQKALDTVFIPCKDGSVEPAAKASSIKEISKVGRNEGFDAALLSSLPSALEKELGERGSFDNIVIKQVEDELVKKLALLNETLAAGAPAREERAQKVSAAAAALEAAKVKEAAAKEAAKTAAEECKAAVAAGKEAAKALKAFFPEMKATAREVKDLKEGLEEFKDGVLKSFAELVDRSSAPEPVPEEAPAEAAAPATAEAAA